MVVAGVMSGTSADGVDVAVCRISPARVKGGTPVVKLLGHVGVAYPKAVRAAVLDYCMFRSAKVSRVLENLGGIGNLTAIPAGAGVDEVMAFDIGPGNMVIDACMRRLYEREFDKGGVVARTGNVLKDVVEKIL